MPHLNELQRSLPIWRECRYCRGLVALGRNLEVGDKITKHWWWGSIDGELMLFSRPALDLVGDGSDARHQPFDVPPSLNAEMLEEWLDA